MGVALMQSVVVVEPQVFRNFKLGTPMSIAWKK